MQCGLFLPVCGLEINEKVNYYRLLLPHWGIDRQWQSNEEEKNVFPRIICGCTWVEWTWMAQLVKIVFLFSELTMEKYSARWTDTVCACEMCYYSVSLLSTDSLSNRLRQHNVDDACADGDGDATTHQIEMNLWFVWHAIWRRCLPSHPGCSFVNVD